MNSGDGAVAVHLLGRSPEGLGSKHILKTMKRERGVLARQLPMMPYLLLLK